MDYDICIIGGGPAGYLAGIRAAQLGAKAAVIEMDQLGIKVDCPAVSV